MDFSCTHKPISYSPCSTSELACFIFPLYLEMATFKERWLAAGSLTLLVGLSGAVGSYFVKVWRSRSVHRRRKRWAPLQIDDDLVLRNISEEDVAAFSDYRSDPNVARYQGWNAPYSIHQATAFVAQNDDADWDDADSWCVCCPLS